ncbi:hypothetical protein BC829DRAFT_444273 [Chytridium lagenaria]|nr:hypothetical protein BC829DRAFT_444273 [Chytridium lagenaria]
MRSRRVNPEPNTRDVSQNKPPTAIKLPPVPTAAKDYINQQNATFEPPDVPGLQDWRCIWVGLKCVVWRAWDVGHRKPVIVKCSQSRPDIESIQCLKAEFAITRHVNSTSTASEIVAHDDVGRVVKAYSMYSLGISGVALAFEDIGGDSLTSWIKTNSGTGRQIKRYDMQAGLLGDILLASGLRLRQSLDIMRQVCLALEDIHNSGILHKDINPNNIIVRFYSGKVIAQVIDFSISTHTSSLHDIVTTIEGTLGYMAPEQTGRFNRKLDFRTDLYSLGCTFYVMLVNKRPFEDFEEDDMSIIHAHIARPVEPPDSTDPLIPGIVSDIVCKLMEKAPENRYQSASGLRKDLERVLSILDDEDSGASLQFSLGDWDIPNSFSFPEALKGRQTETKAMIDLLSHTCTSGAAGLLAVTGHSGIGKSVFVREIQKFLTAERGSFFPGKCDQIQTKPFACFTGCFEEALKRILAGSDEHFNFYRSRIVENVRRYELLFQYLSDLESIVKSQKCRAPTVRKIQTTIKSDGRKGSTTMEGSGRSVGVAQSQMHLNQAFTDLINVLTSAAKELSKKKERDEQGEEPHIINESSYPICFFLDDVQWADVGSLSLLEYLFTSARCQNVFIILAYRDNEVGNDHPVLVSIEAIRRGCDAKVDTLSLGPLSQTAVTEYVVETLRLRDTAAAGEISDLVYRSSVRLRKASAELDTSDAKIRECISVSDDILEILRRKFERISPLTLNILECAAAIGATFSIGVIAAALGVSLTSILPNMKEALLVGVISSLSPWSAKLDESMDGAVLEKLVEIDGLTYRWIHDRMQQTAYQAIPQENVSSLHLQIGTALLNGVGERCPGYSPILPCFQIETGERQNILEIADHFVKATSWAQTISKLSNEEQNTIACVLYQAGFLAFSVCSMDAAQKFFTSAISVMGEGRSHAKNSKLAFDMESMYFESHLHGFTAAAWNGDDRACKQLFDNISKSLTDKEKLSRLLIEDAIRRTHRDPLTSIALIGMGLYVLKMAAPKDYARCGNLIVALEARYPKTPDTVVGVWGAYGAQLIWTTDYRQYNEKFYDIFIVSVKEIGELSASNHSIFLWASTKLWMNQILPEIHELFPRFLPRNFEWGWFGDAEHDETSMMSGDAYLQILVVGCIFGTYAYFNRRFAQVSRLMDFIRPLRKTAGGMTIEDKQSLATASLKKLKVMAKDTPMTELHRYQLLQAGMARLKKKRDQTISLYTSAAEEALKNKFFFEAGLGLELLAEYLMRQGFPYDAYRGLLLRTYECFSLWGSAALLSSFIEKYPTLLNDVKPLGMSVASDTIAKIEDVEADGGATITSPEQFFSGLQGQLRKTRTIANTDKSNTGTIAQDALDFGSLIKASHQISKQTGVESILKETLQVVLENSGAMRALVLKTETIDSIAKTTILHEADVRRQPGSPINLRPSNTASRLPDIDEAPSMSDVSEKIVIPEMVASYAARAGKALIIKDVTSTDFFSDPYFTSHKVKSVLCYALRSQSGNSLGLLLYLEHPASGVFTENRIRVLEILLKQAALDVEKAQTYEAINKFVPSELLSLIGIKNITEAHLGDTVEREMAVFFADIRGFTAISEKLTAEENFDFVNGLLSVLVPKLEEHGLVIDKFIGDAIMALCADEGGNAEKCSVNAVRAAVAMQDALRVYNSSRAKLQLHPLLQNVKVGAGIHTGIAMLGLVGSSRRLNVTTISDTVNTASRIESITKMYSATVLISNVTYSHLPKPCPFNLRMVDEVILKGQSKALQLFEVIDAEPDNEIREKKLRVLSIFNEAMEYYRSGRIELALSRFEWVLSEIPEDGATLMLAERCRNFLVIGIPEPWNPTWVWKDK